MLQTRHRISGVGKDGSIASHSVGMAWHGIGASIQHDIFPFALFFLSLHLKFIFAFSFHNRLDQAQVAQH